MESEYHLCAYSFPVTSFSRNEKVVLDIKWISLTYSSSASKQQNHDSQSPENHGFAEVYCF